MNIIRPAVKYIAPIFIVTSPITSYFDQIRAIHASRSSAGFSLEIPLIMLIASISKIFYYFGEPYDAFLLVQACIMIVMQIILLHVALRNRPLSESSRDMSVPFSAAKKDRRPYNFWQWRSARPYWLLIIYFTVLLGVLQALLGRSRVYVTILGYFALTMEALLPIPQIISNHTNRSCKGFRLSVLLNWLLGDVMKMTFFFLSESAVPVAFKACGFFQWACDIYLGIQYRQFGTGA